VSRSWRSRNKHAVAAFAVLGGLGALALGSGPLRSGTALAEGATSAAPGASGAPSPSAPPTAGDSFVPALGLPASNVVALGAAPESGETWAYGTVGEAPASTTAGPRTNQLVLLDHTEAPGHTEADGWQVVALPDNAKGGPLATGAGSTFPSVLGGLGGRVTRAGGVVLLTDGGIVTRDPGGEPKLLTASAAALLGKGESLPPTPPPAEAPTAYAALEEAQHTGILIAPYGEGSGSSPGVLHYDGSAWTREPIETPAAGQPGYKVGLRPAAIACAGAQPLASSPEDCWLLAAYRSSENERRYNRLTLFRRVATGGPNGYAWQEQAVENPASSLLGEIPAGRSEPVAVQTLSSVAQTLTATSQGVWVDMMALTLRGHETDITELVTPGEGGAARVLGTWCEAGEPFCPPSGAKALGAPLPGGYRSFAWPGSGSGDPGARIITGLERGTMLELPGGSGGAFSVVTGAGGENGASAFSDPQHGWIADGSKPWSAADGSGQPQAIEILPTHQLQGESESVHQLQEESVPFRRPLYALAQQPGTSPGDPQAQYLAVGERGEIARYVPGEGWQAEALYNGSGKVLETTLRGVAWPEPERAYAVGDNGAMWVWQAATGRWEPDPAEPADFFGQLDAIAFSASNPALGYAVGRQGALLSYGKTWEQEQLPPELQNVNFTSVAFTGPEEAIASYRYIALEGATHHEIESGGIAIKRGSEPWHVDPQASALLATLPASDRVLSKIAGLPDGGAVAAGPELALERDATDGPWRFSVQPLPEAQNVSALAAYREGSGAVRAVASVELDEQFNPHKADILLLNSPFSIDVPAPVSSGEPPPFLPPDWVPNSGYVLKETAAGWSDMEHETLPAAGRANEDMPARPDPVFALLVSSSGASGVAVGGQTGNIEGAEPHAGPVYTGILADQTAAAMRFPANSASANGAAAKPIATAPGSASFAIAGQAACAEDCAAYANEQIGPDVDLTHAIQDAGAIATGTAGGLKAFLYTGGRLEREKQSSLSAAVFERELDRYSQLLGGASLPVLVAASPDDLGPKHEIGPFIEHLGQQHLPGAEPGKAYYEYTTGSAECPAQVGPAQPVDVIVLDFSTGELGTTQRAWLKAKLEAAQACKAPAIVVGNLSLTPELPDGPSVRMAADFQQVSAILVQGHASAYFFDYPAANVRTSIQSGGESIPAFGTGTLGYVPSPDEHAQADALGSSGFLLAEVQTAKRKPDNVAPVAVRVVPNVAQLAVDPLDGTLLRRSQVALFDALARRPRGGVALTGGGPANGTQPLGPDPYDPIPFDCLGANCAQAIPTEYTFTSSDPEVGGFVEHDPSSNDPRQALLGANNLPVPDEPRTAAGEPTANGRFVENKAGEPVNERGEAVPRDQSGLFCAYNAGTTTISVTTGGLTYSEPITVQGGSAEYPCGTVPLKNRTTELPVRETFKFPETAPVSSPSAPGALRLTVPLLPPAQPQAKPPPRRRKQPVISPFLYVPAQLIPLLAAVPPPPPPTLRPTPPSGTAQVPAQSPVTQPVGVAEEEHEKQAVTEHVYNMAAYHHDDQGPIPSWPLGLLLVLAVAGVALRPDDKRRERVYVRSSAGRDGGRGGSTL
jgi:hypothetical protein